MLGEIEETTHTHRCKADFNGIYTAPDPRPYYRTLSRLDYQIPRLGLPVVEAVLDRARQDGSDPTMLDVCCSYGINSALLYAADPAGVAARYCSARISSLNPEQLAADDARRTRRRRRGVTVLGLDASVPAIRYARRAGLLADGWSENLEGGPASPGLLAGLRDVGAVVCTGGFGYVGEPTFEQIVRAVRHPDRLWLAVFVLRVFDYSPMERMLADHGLVTQRLPQTFRQRRFTGPDEQEAAVHDVLLRGCDPTGKEADGWFHADCYVTRPAAEPPLVVPR